MIAGLLNAAICPSVLLRSISGTRGVNPRGAIEAQASYGEDELLVHEIDLDMVREVRDQWQFFRDRRPDSYGPLTDK